MLLTRDAQAIVAALEKSGPVFIKLAQWASTRRDILPRELCDAMGTLHEHVHCEAQPVDVEHAERLVPGLKIKDLLGGGCIAQVYSADLQQEGSAIQDVAVKVRRGQVKDLLQTDVPLLRLAARMAEIVEPNLRWLAMPNAVDNFGWYLLQQTDFTIEAAHLTHFAENFKSGTLRGGGRITIPGVIVSYQSVLVTELAKGVSLSAFIRQGHPNAIRDKVFKSLTDMMARMMLLYNFLHGDLHPGNVFVYVDPDAVEGRSQPLITLIDAGIAISMDSTLSEFMKTSTLAAFRRDALGLGKSLIQLHSDEGLCEYAQDVPKLEHDVGYLLLAGAFMCDKDIWGKMFESYEEYRASRVSEYFAKMINLLSKHRVRVSPSLWSLMTALALIEGSIAELGYGVNVLRAATPYLFDGGDMVSKIGSSFRLKVSEAKRKLTR